MNTAGLNISGRRLEAVVQGRAIIGAPKHLFSDEYELPDSNGSASARVKEVLLELKKNYKISSVVFGLEPEKFARLEIELPDMKESDLRSALSFELEKYLPLLPEEYAFDFRRISSGKTLKLLVYAIKKDSLNWIKTALEGTGVRLKGIRCGFLEFLDEFTGKYKKPDAVVAYAGKENCYIARLDSSLPLSVSTVPAEKARIEIESMESKEVFVAGDDNFSTGNMYERVPFTLADVLAQGRKKGMDFRSEKESGRKDLYGTALWGSVSLVLFLYLITPVYSYYRDISTEKRVEKEISSMKSSANELLEMRREMDGIKEKEKFLLRARSEVNRPIKALSSLSRILPKDAWLSSFQIDEKGKIEIKGFSKKSALLINPLEKSSTFKNVQFSAPVYTREGWERFSIKMEMEE